MVIYKLTNKITGKSYIGQTILKNPWRRIRTHFLSSPSKKRYYINNAVIKYGKENFSWEIIDKADTQEELDHLEIKYIREHNTLTPNGYNEKTGGRGGSKMTPEKIKEVSKKVSAALKGKSKSEQHKKAMSESRKGFTSANRVKARMSYIARMKREGKFCKITSTNVNTKEQQVFDSISDCARTLGLFPDNIYKAARGFEGRRQSGGYTFVIEKYKDEAPKIKENPMKGIRKINKGGYSLIINREYIGYRKTLEEIIELKRSQSLNNP